MSYNNRILYLVASTITIYFTQFWEVQEQVTGRFSLWEGPFLGSQMATFSLFPYMVDGLPESLKRALILLIRMKEGSLYPNHFQIISLGD